MTCSPDFVKRFSYQRVVFEVMQRHFSSYAIRFEVFQGELKPSPHLP